jgi:hypothetical protein
MDANDIIIVLADHLRTFEQNDFSIIFSEVDKQLELPPGSTEKHIESAAKDAELAVVRKGATRISLRRPNEFGF